MPTHTWNGRYRGEGGGGTRARSLTSDLPPEFVLYATEHRHRPSASAGGTFALNPDGTLNNQLILDFAQRSLHEMVLKAKALINAYYGTAPKYSYWNGCSTGGRQGLMAVQRFPEEYDGLVIAAPAINWDRFIPSELWPQIVMRQLLGGPITSAKLNAVTNASIAVCDGDDRVVDGVINDPRTCSTIRQNRSANGQRPSHMPHTR